MTPLGAKWLRHHNKGSSLGEVAMDNGWIIPISTWIEMFSVVFCPQCQKKKKEKKKKKKWDIIGHIWNKLSQTSRLAIRTQLCLLSPWRGIHNWWKSFLSCPKFQGMLLILGQGWQRQLGCSQEIRHQVVKSSWLEVNKINRWGVSMRQKLPWFCFSWLSQPRKALFAQNSLFQSNMGLFLAKETPPSASPKFGFDSSSHPRMSLPMRLGLNNSRSRNFKRESEVLGVSNYPKEEEKKTSSLWSGEFWVSQHTTGPL